MPPAHHSFLLLAFATIASAQSTTNLSFTASPNPATYPTPITLHCFVPQGVGNGSMTITDGTTTLFTSPSTAEVTDMGVQLSPGNHTLTCSFGGNSGYRAESVTLTVVINQPPLKPSVTTLSVSPNPAVFRQFITYTITVSGSAAAAPTGRINIYSGGTLLVGVTSVTNGTGTTGGNLPVGSQSLTAVYAGDSLYTGSTSAPVTVLVTPDKPLPTSIAILSSPNPSDPGQPVTFTATISSGAIAGLAPTGSISWKDSGVGLGLSGLGPGGTSTFTTTALPGGARHITADYSGDSNFAASSGAVTQVVNQLSTVTTLSLNPAAPAAAAPTVLTATVASKSGAATGTVTFRDGATVLGASTLKSGAATLSWAPAIGAHTLTATYAGDSTYLPSTSTALPLAVKGAVSLTLTANPPSPATGQPATLTAALAGTPLPTGAVLFSDGASTLGTATLDSTGRASIAVTSGFSSGDHDLTASYAGDANYLAAVSPRLTLHVSQIPTVVTISEGIVAGGISLNAVVTSPSGTPTGAVQFQDSVTGQSLGAATLAAGRATLTLTSGAPVGDPVRAVYPGDGSFPPSSSATVPLIALVNGFSYAYGAFAPDELVTAFGAGLASDPAAAPSADLPTTLAGVSVTVAGADGSKRPAPLYYASPTQVNFVIPADAPSGPAQLTVTSPKAAATIAVVIGPSAPSLVAAGQAIRVHADGTQDPPVALSAAPLAFGAATDQLYLVLYGSGLRHAENAVTCAIGGNRIAALYAGAQGGFAGLDQVNLQLPDALRGAGAVSLTCAADGQTSNAVELNLQ
jgi:uncharacterized protein (TIGR03437 family)